MSGLIVFGKRLLVLIEFHRTIDMLPFVSCRMKP